MTVLAAIDAMEKLVADASRLRRSSRRSVLGITGPPGAGKSTLAADLVRRLQNEPGGAKTVALLPMDGFHLPNAILEERGLRNVKGAPQTFDAEAYTQLLRGVATFPALTWMAPGFSRQTDEPVPDEFRIDPEVRLVITEGNYLLLDGSWEGVRSCCSEVWYLDVDAQVERRRLVQRQIEECGRSPEVAADWVDRNDLANAVVIEASRPLADRVVLLPDEPD